ncbi:hypothetical protein LTSERUB_2328, partial [Salmonella enterica subsp. enterica serovar Rubislaw str. A4-653]
MYTERKSRYLIKVGVVELLSEYGLFLAKPFLAVATP